MKKRLYSLDFMKYCMMIFVIFHHFQQLTDTDFPGIDFYYGALDLSPLVDGFFILSGFTAIYGLDKLKRTSFYDYMKKKIIRLYPMAMIAVTVNLILDYLYYKTYGVWFSEPGLWKIFNSYLLTFQGGPVAGISFAINPPTWYICVLLICYCLLYFLVQLSDRLGVDVKILLAVVMFIGVGGYMYGFNLPFLTSETSRGYTGFFWGMLLSYWYTKMGRNKGFFAFSAALFAGIVAAGIKDITLYYDNEWGIAVFMLWPALIYVLIFLNDLFRAKIFGVLGCAVYEMYIWHVAGLLVMMIINGNFGFPGVYTKPVMVGFTALMTLAGIALYYLAEKPLTERLMKRNFPA